MTVKEMGPAPVTGRAFPSLKRTNTMAKARRAPSITQLDPVAHRILGDLLADFLAQKLNAAELQEGYVGLSLPALVQHCCGSSGGASQVDFDLAIKQLEDSDLVKTGPMVPYENDPNSGVFIFSFFSKREYAYLTEEGYRAARKSQAGFERF